MLDWFVLAYLYFAVWNSAVDNAILYRGIQHKIKSMVFMFSHYMGLFACTMAHYTTFYQKYMLGNPCDIYLQWNAHVQC